MEIVTAVPRDPAFDRADARPHAAFASFFEATWPDLAGYCTTLLGDQVSAEEVTQETMARVFARFPLLRNPRAYAFRVATNVVHDLWRHRQRTELVESPEGADQPVASVADDPLLAAVRALPDRLRAVVLLHYYADLRIEDVARLLRRPVGTVKRRLHEARAALTELLEETR